MGTAGATDTTREEATAVAAAVISEAHPTAGTLTMEAVETLTEATLTEVTLTGVISDGASRTVPLNNWIRWSR